MTAFARERRKLPTLALAMIAANGAIGLPELAWDARLSSRRIWRE